MRPKREFRSELDVAPRCVEVQRIRERDARDRHDPRLRIRQPRVTVGRLIAKSLSRANVPSVCVSRCTRKA